MQMKEMTPFPSDSELMAAVGAGDISRLDELFERHHASVYRFLRRSNCNSALAQDLTQEAFLRVLRYRSSFRSGNAFKPWLFTIARNVLLNHCGSLNAEPRSDAEYPETPDPGASPERTLEAKTELSRVASALARLSLDQRHALLLARFHDLSYRQIGEILGCTEAAVKARIYRALQTLSLQLGDKESMT
jgi:RNA polymerase sigma-70 factor (ECF subfamily)